MTRGRALAAIGCLLGTLCITLITGGAVDFGGISAACSAAPMASMREARSAADAGKRPQVSASIPAAPAYGGATTYTVDPKDQLQQEQSTRQLGSSSGYTNGFVYDLAGNPTTFRNAANSFNANNQSTASGYMFDGNGSPTLYKGSTLAFDLETHLTQIGASWTAGYNGDGLRAWKQNGSTRTYFLYDGTIPVLELDSSGAVTAVNTFGANGLLSRRSGGASTFYTFDPQGSVC